MGQYWSSLEMSASRRSRWESVGLEGWDQNWPGEAPPDVLARGPGRAPAGRPGLRPRLRLRDIVINYSEDRRQAVCGCSPPHPLRHYPTRSCELNPSQSTCKAWIVKMQYPYHKHIHRVQRCGVSPNASSVDTSLHSKHVALCQTPPHFDVGSSQVKRHIPFHPLPWLDKGGSQRRNRRRVCLLETIARLKTQTSVLSPPPLLPTTRAAVQLEEPCISRTKGIGAQSQLMQGFHDHMAPVSPQSKDEGPPVHHCSGARE
ncbi:hypothetical protein P4O66_016024, partial [Electrophorus voltai]